MKQILDRLDDAVKNNLDERSISYLLQIFFLATEKRHIAHEKEVDKLVDPLTQAKLGTYHLLSYALAYHTFSYNGICAFARESNDCSNVWSLWFGMVGIIHKRSECFSRAGRKDEGDAGKIVES